MNPIRLVVIASSENTLVTKLPSHWVIFFDREKNYSIILNISSMRTFSVIYFEIFIRTSIFLFLFTL